MSLRELRAWVKEKIPELDSELVNKPLDQVLVRLNEETGLCIRPDEVVHDSCKKFLEALKAKYAAMEVGMKKSETYYKRNGLSACLECWVEWMRKDDRDLGASRMKLEAREPNEEHEGYESDPYEDQRQADLKIGAAVGAMIDSLKTNQRWAIHKSQGITTQWNFPSSDYATVLQDAQAELEKKLRKNIATWIYFI